MSEAHNLLDSGEDHNLFDSKPLRPRLCHERLEHLLVKVWGVFGGFGGLGFRVWGWGLGI